MLNTIRLNDSGDTVKIAQCLLGYAEVDGIFSEDFCAAVKEWQLAHKLNGDGIIGQKTWKEIVKTLPTCSTSKNKASNYVYALQLMLGGLNVDGVYGSNTKKAVAAYQSAAGLDSDGICGQKTWFSLIVGAQTKPIDSDIVVSNDKVLNNCVKYLQWDKKWKTVKYSTHTSSQTIGNSGCGPTSMAMIMATFIDPKITPVEMCALAVKQGYRTYDSGTSWGFYKYIAQHYEGFAKYVETASVSVLQAALREGALAVCSMNSGDGGFWTKGGCTINGFPQIHGEPRHLGCRICG